MRPGCGQDRLHQSAGLTPDRHLGKPRRVTKGRRRSVFLHRLGGLLGRFDQSGTTASIVFTAESGRITASGNAESVTRVTDAINSVPGVSMSNPLGPTPGQKEPTLSTDGSSTLGTALFDDVVPSEKSPEEVQTAGQPPTGSGLTTSVGRDAYKSTDPPSRIPELIGLLISFVILAVTFGSLLAAGMPIVSALVGVGVTIGSLVVISNVVTVNSSSPNLAEMLGLAVGIDYAVFLLSRYRAGDDAGELAEASLVHAPGQLWGPLYRALALAALGYQEQAWTEMAQVLEIDPAFLDDPASYFTSRACFDPSELETLLAHFEPFRAGPPI